MYILFTARTFTDEKAQAFKALIGFVPIDAESELPVALYLLRGNALLFMKQEQEAEAWLKQAIEKVLDADDNRLMANMLSLVANDEILLASDTMLARLHHHLAIAQLNIGW